jgi:ligand-binding SRPBCC domain-containing protein/NAD dependent epimerase/dehydratase family enzyme
MPTFEFQSTMPTDAFSLFRYHSRPGAFERLAPPWEKLRIVERVGSIKDGDKLHFRIYKGPIHIDWVAIHEEDKEGYGFWDRQQKGPFKSWEHHHQFIPKSERGSILKDTLQIEYPLGPLGYIGGHMPTRKMMARMFHFRHKRTYIDLKRISQYRDQPSKTIVIVGRANGMVDHLASFLSVAGHHVYAMRQNTDASQNSPFIFEPYFGKGACNPLEDADAILHTGLAYDTKPFDGRDESRFDYLHFLARQLKVIHDKPQSIIHLEGYKRPLDAYIDNVGFDTKPRSHFKKERELFEAARDDVNHEVKHELFLHFGSIIRPSFGYLVDTLMRMETFLFLSDGARTADFCWISQEDLIGAIHHVLYCPKLEGDLALIAPQQASRNELQEILVKHNFLAYTTQRVLKVLPWASPGNSPAIDEQLLEMPQIAETGFDHLAANLSDSFELEFDLNPQ